MKYVIMIILIGVLGCNAGNPVPENAFKECLEVGGTPVYKSGASGTHFSCMKENQKIKFN